MKQRIIWNELLHLIQSHALNTIIVCPFVSSASDFFFCVELLSFPSGQMRTNVPTFLLPLLFSLFCSAALIRFVTHTVNVISSVEKRPRSSRLCFFNFLFLHAIFQFNILFILFFIFFDIFVFFSLSLVVRLACY